MPTPTAGTAPTSTTSTTTTSTTTTTPADLVAACAEPCNTAADCAYQIPAFDEDNYECTPEGACLYTGCNTDSECENSIGAGWVCDTTAAFFPVCNERCLTAADCAFQGAGVLYDEDHYECDIDNLCRWQGCQSDSECTSVFGAGYVCHPSAAYGISTCLTACNTAADCDLGTDAFDADNYDCDSGACVYQGCNSDQECEDSLGFGAVCLD